jgi:hypothetical protein
MLLLQNIGEILRGVMGIGPAGIHSSQNGDTWTEMEFYLAMRSA